MLEFIGSEVTLNFMLAVGIIKEIVMSIITIVSEKYGSYFVLVLRDCMEVKFPI